jgi:hypothetical protein
LLVVTHMPVSSMTPPVVRFGGNPLAHGVSGYQAQSCRLGKRDAVIARCVPDLG